MRRPGVSTSHRPGSHRQRTVEERHRVMYIIQCTNKLYRYTLFINMADFGLLCACLNEMSVAFAENRDAAAIDDDGRELRVTGTEMLRDTRRCVLSDVWCGGDIVRAAPDASLARSEACSETSSWLIDGF